MPNVDSCVRAAEAGLCQDRAIHAKQIAAIPNGLRVKVFRDKSEQGIDDILKKCSESTSPLAR